MKVEHDLLQSLWAALNAPPTVGTPYAGRRILQKIVLDGWMHHYQLEDLVYAFDSRLIDYRSGVDLEKLSEILGYRWVTVMNRPRMRSVMASGSTALSAIDAAAFLLELEALGFGFDPSVLIDAVRPGITKQTLVTESELDVFWSPKMRGKKIVTLEVDERERGFGGIKAGKFPNGFRYEIWLNEDQTLRLLSVKGPKYRPARRAIETKCPKCGYTWWRNDPDSSASHRKEHKVRMIALDPQPHDEMIRAQLEEPEPELVMASSPNWKQAEMYRRAWAFKREMRFDFVQWESPEGSPDPDAQGILFPDDDGKILGAVAFRWREPDDKTDPPFWGLQWVWVCPQARRSGILAQRWPSLRERFGDFYVEGPVSEAMQTFLKKHGDENLMRWPSKRTATTEGTEC